MAKLQTPLLSLDARGDIANALQFQKQPAGNTARKKPAHRDANTPLQLEQRNVFQKAKDFWLSPLYKPAFKQAWHHRFTDLPTDLTIFAAFMSSTLRLAELESQPIIPYEWYEGEPSQPILKVGNFLDINNSYSDHIFGVFSAPTPNHLQFQNTVNQDGEITINLGDIGQRYFYGITRRINGITIPVTGILEWNPP